MLWLTFMSLRLAVLIPTQTGMYGRKTCHTVSFTLTVGMATAVWLPTANDRPKIVPLSLWLSQKLV